MTGIHLIWVLRRFALNEKESARCTRYYLTPSDGYEKMKLFLIATFSLFYTIYSKKLNDVTGISVGNNIKGKAVAYGDFNADKNTDIFVISENGTSTSADQVVLHVAIDNN